MVKRQMKITNVEAIPLQIPLETPATFATRTIRFRDYVAVKIHTDEGITGIGYTWYLHSALVINHLLKEHLIGTDPFSIELLWNRMYHEVYRERKGAAIKAVSALDIALWDIIGKSLKQPLYRLLGGNSNKARCYASGGYYKEGKGIPGLVKEMTGYVARGFKAVKMKVGAMPIEKDLERIKAVRKALGSEIEIMIDANNGYTVTQAIKAGRAFEKYDVAWFEEPVWPDDIKGSAEVASALDTPVASGELEYTRYGFRDLIVNGAIDIAQPDATACGGITEWIKIAHMASAWNMPVAPHGEHEVHMHLVAAVPNGSYVEYFLREADIMKEMLLFIGAPETVDGWLEIPPRPGLGLEFDEKILKKYRVKI